MNFKRICATLLCVTMVLCETMPHFASELGEIISSAIPSSNEEQPYHDMNTGEPSVQNVLGTENNGNNDSKIGISDEPEGNLNDEDKFSNDDGNSGGAGENDGSGEASDDGNASEGGNGSEKTGIKGEEGEGDKGEENKGDGISTENENSNSEKKDSEKSNEGDDASGKINLDNKNNENQNNINDTEYDTESTSSDADFDDNVNDSKKQKVEAENDNVSNDVSNDESEKENIRNDKASSSETELDNIENTYGEENIVSTDSELEKDEEKEPFFGYVDSNLPPIEFKERNNNRLFGSNLERSYDSRNVINDSGYSVVGPIRDQSPLGTCWAFATIGMMETSIRIKNLVTGSTEAEYEKNADLSEAAFSYYVIEGLKNVTNSEHIDRPGVEGRDYNALDKDLYHNEGYDGVNFGNVGGNYIDATLVGTTYMGATLEENVPYNEVLLEYMENNGLTGDANEYAFNRNAYEMANVSIISKQDRLGIKEAVMRNGSVGVSYHEAQKGYSIKNVGDEWYYMSPRKLDGLGNKVARNANHAVLIVGWDDDVPAEYFTYYNKDVDDTDSPVGPGAWLIRNSWGEYDNSHDGYFWLSYYDPSISDGLYSIDAVKADTYKYNYHYDTTSSDEYFDTLNDLNTYEIGNIFKVSDDINQKLDAVNFAHYSPIGNASIKIYTNNNPMENPTDGELRLTQQVSYDGQGIFTIPLEHSITLRKNTYFSVVLNFTGNVKFFVDESVDYWTGNSRVNMNEVERGQSLYKDKDTGVWIDLNVEGTFTRDDILYGRNFRIRALTNEAGLLSFDADGGTGFMESILATPGETIKLPKNVFVKKGCKFLHWVDGNGNEYDDEAEIDLEDNLVLKAVWEETVYNISYGWFDSALANKNKNEITKINIAVYPTASPTNVDYEWDIADSNGLKGYIKGTEVTIYAPEHGNIYVDEDGSYLFSCKHYNSDDVFDGVDIENSFVYVSELNGLDNLVTSRVQNMERMFAGLGLYNMTDPTMSAWPWTLKANPQSISLDVSSFDTSNVTNMSLVFEASAIKDIDISNFNTENVETMNWMFAQCELLETLDLSTMDTSALTSAEGMFEEAISLTSINFDNFTLKNATDLDYMFSNLRSITTLDLSSFDTTNVTQMQEMFNGCVNLENIYVSSTFKTNNVTSSNDMFADCNALVGGNGTRLASISEIDPSHISDKTYAKIDKEGTLGYFTSTGYINVTFDLDGKGDNFTRQVENYQKLERPADPVAGAYIFHHWYEVGYGEDIVFDFNTVFHLKDGQNRTLKASWTKKRIQKVEGLTQPTRVDYNVGDTIDLNGLRVKVYYKDNTSEEITYSEANKDSFIIRTNYISNDDKVNERSFVSLLYDNNLPYDNNKIKFENYTKDTYQINILDINSEAGRLPAGGVIVDYTNFIGDTDNWTNNGHFKDYFKNNRVLILYHMA